MCTHIPFWLWYTSDLEWFYICMWSGDGNGGMCGIELWFYISRRVSVSVSELARVEVGVVREINSVIYSSMKFNNQNYDTFMFKSDYDYDSIYEYIFCSTTPIYETRFRQKQLTVRTWIDFSNNFFPLLTWVCLVYYENRFCSVLFISNFE